MRAHRFRQARNLCGYKKYRPRCNWHLTKACLKVKVAQSCPTLCDSMEILQARILQWVAFPFSRGSSQHRDRTQVSRVAGGFFTS